MRSLVCFAMLLLVTAPALAASDPASMVVHEWGTFTSLQDEQGNAIGGINVAEEPLPSFVHELTVGQVSTSQPTALQLTGKGLPRADPGVTMRLETPVLYFHPPTSLNAPAKVTVSAIFHGGWLTQFYPAATITGLPAAGTKASLNAGSESSLTWQDVEVGGEWPTAPTDSRVWLSPRAVKAANVRVGGEAERFLFYRGVGHMNAPLRLVRHQDGLRLMPQVSADLGDPIKLGPLWVYEVHRDGKCAFHTMEAIDITPGSTQQLDILPATFLDGSFAAENLLDLKDSMRAALIQQGLFADEADALLQTWQESYFKSPGMRLFFLVPRAWTDHYLPLKVSVTGMQTDISRVMVGRIDIVTPGQRAAMRELASAATTPEDRTAAYADLGRFGDALLLDENYRRPTQGLADFLKSRGLFPPVK